MSKVFCGSVWLPENEFFLYFELGDCLSCAIFKLDLKIAQMERTQDILTETSPEWRRRVPVEVSKISSPVQEMSETVPEMILLWSA